MPTHRSGTGLGARRMRACIVGFLACVILIGGCAPARSSADDTTSAPRPSAPKVLRLGTRSEPVSGVALFAGGGDANAQHTWMFHAGLTAFDDQGNLQPRVAQTVPSLDNGDWKLLPDGGMELTWKLRPDVRWHDGTPLSAEDFVFGIQVARDRELPLPHTGGISLVSEVTARDAQTLVVRWAETFFAANQGTPAEFPALPRHLVGDLYRTGDKQAFINTPFWTTGWVGLGPYKMGEWVPGSHTEALAFDNFFLGRPKIDRVIIRYSLDANATVAALLSGDIDMVTVGSLKPEELAPVKSAWDAQGGGTFIPSMTDLVWARLQFRDLAAPWVRDVRVRRALLHLVERQGLADTFAPGGGPADLFASTSDPVYRLAEQRGFARYPYSVTQAERLLADAGWARGTDGVFQNGAGQQFSIEVRIVANTPINVQQGEALADQWKRGGLNAPLYSVPGTAANKSELKANPPGVFMQPDSLTPDTFEVFTSSQVATAQNSWQGRNLLGYVNPEFDRRYAQVNGALDLGQRQSLYADLLRWTVDELPYLPLYYSFDSATTAFHRGIRGPTGILPGQKVGTWNIHEWEMD
jgi:peptide/nickel transport system substrate-binding protein